MWKHKLYIFMTLYLDEIQICKFIKQIGPYKRVGWRKKLKIQKIMPNKQAGWKTC